MGIKFVAANVVFENVWAEGDEVIFESQLRELADYIIDKELYYDHSVRFFDPQVGNALTEDDLNSNFCGTGKMLAIDCHGNFYPCIRFYDISLSNRHGRKIGDIYSGINKDRLRPFYALTLQSQSRDECVKCEVGKGCAWCSGCNYDSACTDTIFERATFICKMHKANVRANEYFWNKFAAKSGLQSEKEKLKDNSRQRELSRKVRFAYIMTKDKFTPHCNYRARQDSLADMSQLIFDRSVEFCHT